MKKQLTGTVINTSSQNTVKVEVIRHWTHPLYLKTTTKRKRYLADNLNLKLSPGDQVIIEETRPVSKLKKFTVVKKI